MSTHDVCDCGRLHERFEIAIEGAVIALIGCPVCCREGGTAEALRELVRAAVGRMRERGIRRVEWTPPPTGEER